MYRDKHTGESLQRIVVKIGSSVICENNRLILEKIENLVKQISTIYNDGIKVVVVTSGAIVSGMESLGLKKKPNNLPDLQAVAAVGQNKLMGIYDKLFKKNNISIAQVLLTREDIHHRNRYLNAKNTLMHLLRFKTVPVVNENDTVSVDEIKIGDNDTLSALVTTLIDGNWLIILSDVEGIYVSKTKIDIYDKYMDFYDNKKNSDVKVVRNVKKIPQDMEAVCRGSGCHTTVGGMATKINSARIVANCGIPCAIVNGNNVDVLHKILKGQDIGTYFCPDSKKTSAKKRWIGYGAKTKGSVIVDDGAEDALINKGKSLLASGIIGVEGKFSQGDTIAVKNNKKDIFSKGLTYYSSEELKKIKGRKTTAIKKILGFKYYDEVVHRDNLVLL